MIKIDTTTNNTINFNWLIERALHGGGFIL